MVTMVDELYDRQYRAARAELNGAIIHLARHFAQAFGNAFRVLNRIEYSAPWTKSARSAGYR
jgi:hypothetical protein